MGEGGAKMGDLTMGLFFVCLFVCFRAQNPFLASQDALEVIMSVSQSITLRTKLTDVTLVSEDTC